MIDPKVIIDETDHVKLTADGMTHWWLDCAFCGKRLSGSIPRVEWLNLDPECEDCNEMTIGLTNPFVNTKVPAV